MEHMRCGCFFGEKTVTALTKPAAIKEKRLRNVTFFIAVFVAVLGFDAYAANEDINPAPVKSCDWNKVRDETGELAGVSWQDQAAICKEMASSLGRLPPIGLLRVLAKVTFILRSAGSTESHKDIAFQAMNVVEARNQTTDIQINETFNTLTKIYNGTNGRVSPKDMNRILRAMGPRARKIDEQGMFSIAAMIMEDKKSGRR